MYVHAFSTYIFEGMLNHIQEQVPTDSPALLSEPTPLHYYLAATWQCCSSDIITASSPLYNKLLDITEYAPETDA